MVTKAMQVRVSRMEDSHNIKKKSKRVARNMNSAKQMEELE